MSARSHMNNLNCVVDARTYIQKSQYISLSSYHMSKAMPKYGV